MARSEFLKEEESLTIGLAGAPPEVLLTPNIGVIGVGGAGGNAVNNMVNSGLTGVSLFAANTDAQALSKSLVADKIQLGVSLTKGLGAGANPDIGRASAQESAAKIKEYLAGFHLLFLTAGMGGGTGTGATPVIAKIAKEMGILTVGVVSKPFSFEGKKRMRVAEEGIAELQKHVDTLIVIPNQNLFRIVGDKTTFAEAFKMADNVLCQGVRSITDLVLTPGLINLDFADVTTVLSNMGRAMMGTGEAVGADRAEIAAEKAVSNPLLDNGSIKGAKSIIINVSGGMDLTLMEVDRATGRIISELDAEEAVVIFGAQVNEELQGKIRVSLVATGIRAQEPSPVQPVAPVRAVEIQSVVIEEFDARPPVIPAEETAQPPLLRTPVQCPVQAEVFEQTSVTLVVEAQAEPVPDTALFDERPPSFKPVPITDAPDIKPEINLDSKKADANVKPARTSLFDLVPHLMGKSRAPASKPKPTEAVEAPTLNFDDDLPAFLRRK